MRLCRKCNESKALDQFNKSSLKSNSCVACYRKYCSDYRKSKRAKLREHSLKWVNTNKEKARLINDRYRLSPEGYANRRNRQLINLYGINASQWIELFNKQNRCCAICFTDKPHGRNWHTDHDHVSGRVRGILCYRCNNGLGLFKDNTANLKQACVYLDNVTDSVNIEEHW